MRHEIDNPMTIDSLWADKEREPKVVGECAGCGEDIYSHELWLDFAIQGEDYQAHQNSECCYQFVASISICRGGEEE